MIQETEAQFVLNLVKRSCLTLLCVCVCVGGCCCCCLPEIVRAGEILCCTRRVESSHSYHLQDSNTRNTKSNANSDSVLPPLQANNKEQREYLTGRLEAGRFQAYEQLPQWIEVHWQTANVAVYIYIESVTEQDHCERTDSHVATATEGTTGNQSGESGKPPMCDANEKGLVWGNKALLRWFNDTQKQNKGVDWKARQTSSAGGKTFGKKTQGFSLCVCVGIQAQP